MKILISHDGSPAHYFIRLGLQRAWQACGHEALIWDIRTKNAYDMFDEFKPNLFWGQTYNLTSSIINCISESPLMKVVLRAADWGIEQDNIDLNKFPVLVASENEKRLVQELLDKTGKPNFIHCHYHPNRIKNTHNYWHDNMGIKIVGLPSAADIFDYTNGQKIPEFETDICFVGGYWGYKGKTLSKYLLPLCSPNENYRIKIFGNQPWGCPQYCGYLPDHLVKHALASATICPNISEPHSQHFGYDIVERPFKLLSNKCFCISDYVDSMAKDIFINNEIVFADSPYDFKEKVDYFIKNPEKRLGYIERGYDTVLLSETYFHRIAKVFEELNLSNEAINVNNIYNKIKKDLKL